MPAMPVATPIRAVSMGNPAATTEPRVMSNTAMATSTPIASVEPMAGACGTAPPPRKICRPSTSLASAMVASSRCVASGISVIWPANDAWAMPTVRSGDTSRAVAGSTTPVTPGNADASASTVPITCWYAGSARVRPSGAANTMRPVASPAPGIRSLSSSSAACAGVPGIENDEVIVPEKASAAPPMPSRSTTQAMTKAQRRRAARCPRRYSRVDISSPRVRSDGFGVGRRAAGRLGARRRRRPHSRSGSSARPGR
jgi:hypothetical protein